MRIEKCPSYPVSIFIAVPSDPDTHEAVETVCRSFCDAVGLCVSVTRTEYIYTNGQESGVVVGLINYPRFPSLPEQIVEKAKALTLLLISTLNQTSASIQTPDETIWFSFREEDN